MISTDRIKALAEERLAELDKGLFIVEISVSPTNQISVEIDSFEGGVSISDCVSVSRNIEHNLDREVEDFELQVSSPGLTNSFKIMTQYYKNVGKPVKVLLMDGSKIEGELVRVTEEAIVLKTEEKVRVEGKKKKELVVTEHELSFNQIKETKKVILFK
ncbi:MAG: ribosome assembly cofactor RimP [Flavobacteriales bacterium]